MADVVQISNQVLFLLRKRCGAQLVIQPPNEDGSERPLLIVMPSPATQEVQG